MLNSVEGKKNKLSSQGWFENTRVNLVQLSGKRFAKVSITYICKNVPLSGACVRRV